MTRKDYVLIAKALKQARDQIPNTNSSINAGEFVANSTAARLVAYALADDNPRFDRQKFLTACGVES
jgi:hypothetical protein